MKNMRELIILFFCLILGINSAFAYDLVLPKEKRTIVNTKYAFFIGKAKNSENIIINDNKVYVASNGAFAHSVKLKDGENRIVIRSNFSAQIYKIYKNPEEKQIVPELVEFEPKLYLVKKDNTPLRDTPVNQGMNRISHLFKDTNLLIDGQKGDFYRVFLSKNNHAWIDKNSVKENKNDLEIPKFIAMNSRTYKNASVHIIEFSEKIPYTVSEDEQEIVFKIYNPQASDSSIYTVNIRKPEKYTYKTNLANGVYQFKVNELPKNENPTLENLTITVDAGHGGNEKGALGCLGDEEKDINLAIAIELADLLKQMGANVIMTRECDGTVSLDDRVKIAQENDSNIFISIHLNSIPDIEMNIHKNRGTSIYYYNPNSKKLAETVYETVTKALDTRKDGVKTASFAVIRPTDYVGILIETAYMTNPLDSVLYKDESFAREAAKAIADGIFNYVNSGK